jgi:DNA-binding GntR family transcriptional regulator
MPRPSVFTPRQHRDIGSTSQHPKGTENRQAAFMESSASNNGTATAVREEGVREHRAPLAVLPHISDPVVIVLPVPTPEAEIAPRRLRRRPRQGQWEAIGPSRHKAMPAREYAYMRLKALVLSGRFSPGQRLAEERLSRDLGISRTPIREALHKLKSEGLIASLPTRGFAAPRDSQTDAEELVDLRAVLEGYALRVICDRLTEQQFQRLGEIVRSTEEAVASRGLCDISRWNARFHDALHALISDKCRIYQQLVTLRQYAFRYSEGTQPERDACRRTAEGHRRILTALRLRDPDLCECAMREHIRSAPRDWSRRERDPFHPRTAEDRHERSTDILGLW